MSATQKWVTGFMGVLMVGTILAMPAQGRKAAATETHAAGKVTVTELATRELPQDQVRDLTY